MIWKGIITICLYFLGTKGQGTNVALNRPTAQSSNYSSSGSSCKAVDGFTATDFFESGTGCTETKYESNPWWAVEFDKPTIVTIVRITNRGDCCGRRLHDFNVGLSSFVPWNGSPLDPTSYPLCAKYVGEVSSGATVELHCISMIFATALIVQIPGADERLTLCEVQVFADRLNYTWTSEASYNDINDNLFDMKDDTCVTKNQTGPGKVTSMGSLTIFSSEIEVGDVTIALKGRFPACNQIKVAYVEINDPSSECDYVQACLPDVTRNARMGGSDSCFLTCKCMGVPCSIEIIPWLGHGKNEVEQVCEVVAFTYKDITQIPEEFSQTLSTIS